MSTDVSEPAASSDESESPRRRRWPWSFLLAGLVIAGAVTYLVYANTRSNAAYDLTVSQLLQCTTCAAQAVRVEGVVQGGSIQHSQVTEQLSFVISDGQQRLAVVYAGVVPDIFAAGIQVVVEGHYLGRSPFQALTLLTKCPSKFTAATPAP